MTEITVYADETYGFIGWEALSASVALRALLADSHTPIRFLVDVNAVEMGGAAVTDGDLINSYADLSYAEFEGGALLIGSRRFFFGDGVWVGKPTDSVRPNTAADARVVQSADLTRAVPLLPEATRRSEFTVGDITLANSDGALDFIRRDFSIAGRPIRIYVGKPTSGFNQFYQIAELFGVSMEGDLQTLRVKVQSAESYLSTPLQPARYTGNGGKAGDAGLIGQLLPVCLGECFNITPVLLNADQWIYQLHDGPIYSVDAVKERGLELDYSGDDVSTYQQLRALDVALGEFATCLSLGLVKVGFGVAGPAGTVTMDVKGDVVNGVYAASVGNILLRLALVRAHMPSSYLDIASFSNLSQGPVGYYAGSTDMTVSDVYDALLRGYNGWYGSSRDRLVRVGKLREPNDFTPQYYFDVEITDIEELALDPPARWEQAVYYKKNWTVMSNTDLSEALDADIRQELQLPGKIYKRTSAEAKARHLTAVRGEAIDTFAVDQSTAAAAATLIMSLHRETRRLFRVQLPRAGLQVDTDMVVGIRVTRDGQPTSQSRFGFGTDYSKFLVVGNRMDGRLGYTELTLWGGQAEDL